MANILNLLLGAQFPNLCFVAGLLLFLIGIFDGGIKVKNIKLPSIRLTPRILSGVMGVALLMVPTGKFILDSNTLGLYRMGNVSYERESFGFSTPAYAQERNDTIRLVIREKHKIIMDDVFDEKLALYVSDIRLRKPVRIILFRIDIEEKKWQDEREIACEELMGYLKDEDILLDATVKEEIEISFVFKEQKFTLKILKILWYIIGEDYMEIEIFPIA